MRGPRGQTACASAERISPGETVKGPGTGPRCAQCAVANAHQGRLPATWACLASCRAPGHPRAPEEGARGPVSSPRAGLPWTSRANRAGQAGALAPPRRPQLGSAASTHPSPPVPEGPHGDAGFPHEAPHAAATLHAWRAGSGQPGPTVPCPPAPGGSGRGRLSRSLPSPWWEGETEKARGAGRGRPSRPRRSQPPTSRGSSPSPGKWNATAAAPRHNLALLASCQEPAVAWARAVSHPQAGRARGRPPGAQGWPSVRGRPGTGRKAGGRQGRFASSNPSSPRLQPNTRPPRPCPRSRTRGLSALAPGGSLGGQGTKTQLEASRARGRPPEVSHLAGETELPAPASTPSL